LTFFAVSDWGGQEVAPYTTPLQVQMAETMGRVSASFHPKFVLSAGGNFLPAGMPGAWWRDARALSDGYRERVVGLARFPSLTQL
jgi:hypothetical protein